MATQSMRKGVVKFVMLMRGLGDVGEARGGVAMFAIAALIAALPLPPLHVHLDHDHDHDDHHSGAVVHRHLAPHETAGPGLTISDHDDDEEVLDEQRAIAPTIAGIDRILATAAAIAIPHSPLVRCAFFTPLIDASPPHGPPRGPDSSRAPPSLA
jgi:hypothetical protein